MRLIKDYDQAIKSLNLEHLTKDQIYNRYSRVKRSIHRLVTKIRQNDPYAKMRLKQYYRMANLDRDVRTRATNLLILPFLVDKKVLVYNGRSYHAVKIKSDMVGRYLGEFIVTRTKGSHSSKGISSDKIKR